MLLEFIIKRYNCSLHSTVRAGQVDVKVPAKIWKTMCGNWCKIRVNMPLFREEDHVRMFRTKERSDNCYEQMFTDGSLNYENGSNTHVVLNRLQSPSYQGHGLFR